LAAPIRQRRQRSATLKPAGASGGVASLVEHEMVPTVMRMPPPVDPVVAARQRRQSNRIALPSGMLSPWECVPVAPIPGWFAVELAGAQLTDRQSEAQWGSWHGL